MVYCPSAKGECRARAEDQHARKRARDIKKGARTSVARLEVGAGAVKAAASAGVHDDGSRRRGRSSHGGGRSEVALRVGQRLGAGGLLQPAAVVADAFRMVSALASACKQAALCMTRLRTEASAARAGGAGLGAERIRSLTGDGVLAICERRMQSARWRSARAQAGPRQSRIGHIHP